MQFLFNPLTGTLDVVEKSVGNFIGMTEGAIPFGNSTGGLTSDPDNWFYDEVNKRVGIGIGSTLSHQVHVEMISTDNIFFDGSTNPRQITLGALRQEHTAGIAGTRAYHIDINSNGFDDTSGIIIRHDLFNSSNTIRPKGVNLSADVTGATNAHINFLEFAIVGTLDSSMRADAIDVRHGVSVIHHHSGTPVAVEQAFTFDDSGSSFTDTTTAFGSSGTDVAIFVEDNDLIYLGHASVFSTIEVILATVAVNPGVKPTFEYSKGSGTWGVLPVSDDTNGFRENGNIFYAEPDDWATDTVNGVASKYWVRIKRKTNNLSTVPIEDTIKVVVSTTYEWDKDGNLNVASLAVVRTAINPEGYIGIEKPSPEEKLDLQSGAFRFSFLDTPDATSAALAGDGAGNIPNGSYIYRVTFVNKFGQSVGGTISNSVTVTDNSVDGQIDVTVPISIDSSVTARRLWRSDNGGTSWKAFNLNATLNDNTTTTYRDNLATPPDSFGAYDFTIGDDSGAIYTNAINAFSYDSAGNSSAEVSLVVNGGRKTDNDGTIALGVGINSTNKSGVYVTDNFNHSSNGALFAGVIANATLETRTILYGNRNNTLTSSVNLGSVPSWMAVLENKIGAGSFNTGGYRYRSISQNLNNTGIGYGFVSHNYLQDNGSQIQGLNEYNAFYSFGQNAVATTALTNHYDFRAASWQGADRGLVANRYGLYVEFDGEGVTNPWGVYQLASDVDNHFNGRVLIGSTSKDAKLLVAGTVDEVQQITRGYSIQTKFLEAWQQDDTTVVGAVDNDGNRVFPKASGTGIKVDTTTPTFGFADIIGDQFSKNTGATKPTLAAYNGVVQAWQFGNGDEAYMSFHIPHDYVPGTDIFLHIHWSQTSATATGGTVDFRYTAIYAKGHNQVTGSTFTSTPKTDTFSSIDINDGDSGLNQYQHHLTEVVISAATATAALLDRDDFDPDGVIELTFEMDTNSLTNSGAVLDPFIHFVDIHYQTTGLIGTKDKAPDFYA